MAALLGGCSATPLGYLEGSGSRSQDIIQDLGWGLLLICCAVVFLIIVLMAVAIARSRRRATNSDENDVGRDSGGLRLIYWGVALSLPVLVGMAVWSFIASRAIATPPTTPGLAITVTGHRWWWELRYESPSQPFGVLASANEVVIPVGVPVRLDLESADVIHDFWVPKLGPKMDMIPGRTNHNWVQADRPGTYVGQCAEFCGVEHGRMGFIVRALSPQDFESWLSRQRQPAVATGPTRMLFGARCGACHAVRGTDAAGIYGPDLTHFGSRPTLAAMMPNTNANLNRWLADTQGVKPGAQMPQVMLSPVERTQLVGWLESLK
jgi:cytochrome c oxidase subunit 2